MNDSPLTIVKRFLLFKSNVFIRFNLYITEKVICAPYYVIMVFSCVAKPSGTP